MDVPGEFAKTCEEYGNFRELLVQAIAMSDNESEQQVLIKLAAQMDHSLDVAKRLVPLEYAQARQDLEEIQRSTQALQSQFVDAERQVAAAARTAAAPPAAEPVPAAPPPAWIESTLDADLRQYRVELLDLLTRTRQPLEKARTEEREIWQDWSRHNDE